ncbi:MAG: hypothetical protein KF693_09520 [Nitrospira sp.]|nr:hypothetical protein [Nitrospira sp.]
MHLGISLFFAFALLGCKTYSFSPFENVTRIEVRTNSNAPISTITDKSQVASVLVFVNARSDQWGTPWYGVPVPTVVANLYAGTTFVGHFGVGASFFELHRSGGFFSRSASDAERREFMKLLAVPFEKIEQKEQKTKEVGSIY